MIDCQTTISSVLKLTLMLILVVGDLEGQYSSDPPMLYFHDGLVTGDIRIPDIYIVRVQ